MAGTNATTPSLQAFLDAFNAHDVDAIMAFFTDDCVFDMPRGPAPGGRRLVGKQEVRRGSSRGSTGSPTSTTATTATGHAVTAASPSGRSAAPSATGERIEVRGCDLFEFTDGRISRKDSFWKIVE